MRIQDRPRVRVRVGVGMRSDGCAYGRQRAIHAACVQAKGTQGRGVCPRPLHMTPPPAPPTNEPRTRGVGLWWWCTVVVAPCPYYVLYGAAAEPCDTRLEACRGGAASADDGAVACPAAVTNPRWQSHGWSAEAPTYRDAASQRAGCTARLHTHRRGQATLGAAGPPIGRAVSRGGRPGRKC